VNLPTRISFKAVLDLRAGWGFDSRDNQNAHRTSTKAVRTRVPWCYDQVRVCAFCSQMFDDEASYRKAPASPDAAGRGRDGMDGGEYSDGAGGGGGGREYED
jgi:hypothetical protein